MKSDKKYIAIIVLLFAAFVLVEYYAPRPVDWHTSFSKTDKIPYGDYVVYDFLSDIFPGKNIKVTTQSVYNSLEDSSGGKSNYVIINDYAEFDTLDVKTLLNYVASGNNVFIAVKNYFGPLADSLKLVATADFSLDYNAKDSMSLNFVQTAFHEANDFRYRRGTVDNYFTSYDTAHTIVLGRNSKDEPDYIKITRGAGAFYLSTVPLAFTNYNALKGNNAAYISRALSYLPVNNIKWDEYYKVNKPENTSPLRYILSNEALKRSYYIFICGILLYIIFEGKRKQRVIPIIKPLENTSMEFVETIGLLYYQKGTHAGIARKKIQYFLDNLRTRYNIKTEIYSEEFYHSMAHLTGIDKTEIKKLFTYIGNINNSGSIDEDTLIRLNNRIEDFYQKTL